MRRIVGQLTPELFELVGEAGPAKASAFRAKDFPDLMQHVARLAYLNKDHLLFFRGQQEDHFNRAGTSTFYPSIYRGERLTKAEIDLRFDILTTASQRLCAALDGAEIAGNQDVRRRKYIQWSILLRIPRDGDQRSELMSITIPK
jgi:hypothetical protein